MLWKCHAAATGSSSRRDGARAFETFTKAFCANLLIRATGDIITLSPPLIVEKAQIDEMIDTLRTVIGRVD